MSPKAASQESASPLGCRPIAQARPPRQHACDAAGRSIATVDQLGNRTTSVYDDDGRLSATVDALGNRTTNHYDAAGRTSWVEDQRGYITTTVYDAAGRAQARIDQQNNRTTFVYDAAGQQIATVDALNDRTTQDYYDTGWLKDMVDPLGNRTTYSYDSLGNRLTMTDALGRVTTSAYDARGLNSSTTDARGYVTTFIYDALSRQSAVQDARGNLATSVYDAAGRLSAHVDQLGNRMSFTYDAAGRQISRLDAKAQVATYSYDDDGRRTGIQYSDGTLVTLSYDAAGRRTQMQDSTGITTYAHDEFSRLSTVTYPANKTLTYTYDAAGNRATLVDPDGGTTTYSYDGRNLLGWLLNPFTERSTWVYDAIGRVTTMTHANGAAAEQDYDAAGRITAVRNLKSDRSVISIFTYSYDAVANRTGVQEANGDVVTWSYDEIYQLTREQRSGTNAYDVTYSYDGVGNRLTRLEGGVTTTYSYDAANEVTTSEDNAGVTTFTYDANGNTIGELRPNGDRVTYTWDVENHLTKVELPSNVVNTITLDGDGKRRRIEDSDGLRNIVWDAENILAETDNNNATLAQYTLEPETYGILVSQRRSGATSFHHFDALGSTNRLTDANAATLVEYLYRAFGQQTLLSGSSPNRLTWVGRLGYYYQPQSTDYWTRARVCRPAQGRFLSRTRMAMGNGVPLSGALRERAHAGPLEHPYAYADGDPANRLDPAGNFAGFWHKVRTTQWLEAEYGILKRHPGWSETIGSYNSLTDRWHGDRQGLSHERMWSCRQPPCFGRPAPPEWYPLPDQRLEEVETHLAEAVRRACSDPWWDNAYHELGYALHYKQDIVGHGQCPWLPKLWGVHLLVDNPYLDPPGWSYAVHVAGPPSLVDCTIYFAPARFWTHSGRRLAAMRTDTLALVAEYVRRAGWRAWGPIKMPRWWRQPAPWEP